MKLTDGVFFAIAALVVVAVLSSKRAMASGSPHCAGKEGQCGAYWADVL